MVGFVMGFEDLRGPLSGTEAPKQEMGRPAVPAPGPDAQTRKRRGPEGGGARLGSGSQTQRAR